MTPGEDRSTVAGDSGHSDYDDYHHYDDYDYNQFQLEQQEEVYELMAFKPLSLTKPGSGSLGFYGDGRMCAWQNWRIAEHGFVKHGPDGVTVVEEFPPACMLGIDIYAEKTELDDDKFPAFVTQWYSLGQLPLARLEQLGWPMVRLQKSIMSGPGGQKAWEQRLRNPGGLQPCDLNGQPAAEGPTFGSETDDGVWAGSGYWNLMQEVINLGAASGDAIEDKIAAHGISVLNGLQARGGTKELPKSKSAQQKEQLTGESKDAKKIVVPVEVVSWPWNTPATQPTAAATKPAAKPTAAPKVAAAPAPAAQTPPPAQETAASDEQLPSDEDFELSSIVTKLLEKGPLVKGQTLTIPLMRVLNNHPKLRQFTQRGNSDAFLNHPLLNGQLWNYDPATGKIEAITAQ